MQNYCVDVGNTTAALLSKDCPVDASRPKTAMDCKPGELFTCYLAQKADGQLALVNCECQPSEYLCSCTGIGSYLYGDPVVCDDVHKICACAYTGILK